MLKTPYVWAAECREMNQKPSWKLSACWLDFTLPGVMQAAHEKGHPNLYIDHAKDGRIINILHFFLIKNMC